MNFRPVFLWQKQAPAAPGGDRILKKGSEAEVFKECMRLFVSFAKVGALTFGGGYAMLPILQREVVEHQGWATEEELMDYYAIGQCTPGVIAVNTATFIGRKRAGFAGALAATLGVVFPSLVIILVIAALIENFAEIRWVRNALAGVRVCVCVFIFNAVIKLWKSAVTDKATLLIFAVVFLAATLLEASPVLLVLLAAVAGIVLMWTGVRKK